MERYRNITWLSLMLAVFLGFLLLQSCGGGRSPHRFFQVVTDNPAATADQQSAQEGGIQETQLGEALDESPTDEPSPGDTSNEKQDDQFFEIPPESIPPLPEGVVGYMPEWAMDKAVEKKDFALLPQVGYGEEFVESFDFEITHDWAVYEGKEVVRLEVKAFGCNELPFIHILMAVRPLTWTPLFAEPGDIFPLENYYTYMSALDHLGDGYLVMTGNLTNSPVFDEGPQPGSKFTGSGTLVYLYFIDEPNDPGCNDGYTHVFAMKSRLKSWVPTAALELSEVYTYEMFGGDDNPHIGDTSPGTGTSFSRNDKQVSEEPAGWLDWFELTPEQKLQGYPPASWSQQPAAHTTNFNIWAIRDDWVQDLSALQRYVFTETSDEQPDPEGYMHVYLEVDVSNVLDWTESLLVVQFPPSWEYVGQEIGTFFGDEDDRIGTVLTGIYGFCEAGVARIRPRENGSVSGSGWVETLEFKYLARLGGGGGGIDGNKTASWPNHQFWSIRRFCLNHATQVYDQQSFSGRTRDNQETEIYYQFVILREVNGGDYDNNTVFNISDIMPIAALFGDDVSDPEDVLDPATYVDGNYNFTVDIQDITPLAMFFGHKTWATLESLYRVEGEYEISYELWQFVKFFERCPPNIYLPEGSHPWIHPTWYYHLGETGMYIAHHTYEELYENTWAYGTSYIDELVVDGKWVVSGDELGVAFQWTEAE